MNLYTHVLILIFSSPPPLQRDGPYIYITLHSHNVDARTLVLDGRKPVHVPSGWEIAPGDAHDIRACAAHPWQSYYLIFSNGDYYGTAMCPMDYCIGTTRSPSKKPKFSSCLKIGAKSNFFLDLDDEQGTKKNDYADVLLRRRA